MPDRIQKILSSHGIASRRQAEQMILAGRVTINGVTAAIGQSAQYGVDTIEVDGTAIVPAAGLVYIMLNKPRGYVTTTSDEHGRKTVMDLAADAGARVYPVGRLDMNSEGLLLMTNDGQFANIVMHPSYSITKTYEVHVSGDIGAAVALLRKPMMIDSQSVRAESVIMLKQTDDGGKLMISIAEGRNRQIRKMCEQCGLKVRLLKRVSVGPVKIGSLKTGQWRHLTEEERRLIIEHAAQYKSSETIVKGKLLAK